MAASNSAAGVPYLGSKISLITVSDIRYEGILVNVNTANSTVTLRDVCMFGTENRKSSNFVHPSPEVFDFIVFNGKDIKDLTVCEQVSTNRDSGATGGAARNINLHIEEDPAVVAVHTLPNNSAGGGVSGGPPPRAGPAPYPPVVQSSARGMYDYNVSTSNSHRFNNSTYNGGAAAAAAAAAVGLGGPRGAGGGGGYPFSMKHQQPPHPSSNSVTGRHPQYYNNTGYYGQQQQQQQQNFMGDDGGMFGGMSGGSHQHPLPYYNNRMMVGQGGGGGGGGGGVMLPGGINRHHPQGGPNMYNIGGMGGNNGNRFGRGGGMSGRGGGGGNSSNVARGNRAGGSGRVVGELLTVEKNPELMNRVAESFDFTESNKKFDREQLKAEVEAATSNKDSSGAVGGDGTPANEAAAVAASRSGYQKSSFFDTISCETLDRQQGRTAKIDREMQKEIDHETFGAAAAAARGPRYYRRRFRRQNNYGGGGAVGGYGRAGNNAFPQQPIMIPATGNTNNQPLRFA